MKKLASLLLTCILTFGCASVPKSPTKPELPNHCDETKTFLAVSSDYLQNEIIKNEDPNIVVETDIATCRLTENSSYAFSVVMYKTVLDGVVLKEMALVVYLVKTTEWNVVNTELIYMHDYTDEEPARKPGISL